MNPNLTAVQIIPATAGTNLLIADTAARSFAVVPVLAWTITPPHAGQAARAAPVTLAGDAVESDAHPWAVQLPQGQVEVPDFCVYSTPAAWLADLRACAAAACPA